MAFQTGLLIISTEFAKVPQKLSYIMKDVIKHVSNVLYVRIHPTGNLLSKSEYFQYKNNLSTYQQMVGSFYMYASKFCHYLDVRLLLYNLKVQDYFKMNNQIDVCIFDSIFEQSDLNKFAEIIMNEQNHVDKFPEIISLSHHEPILDDEFNICKFSIKTTGKCYDKVALGGTFDNLHNGHKVLLSIGALSCTDIFMVGVTDGDMIYNKKLYELISPCEARMQNVKNFLNDVDPTLQHNIVKISDFAGPAAYDPDIKALILSSETLKGGIKVNEVRKSKNLNLLDFIVIPLVTEEWRRNEVEEEKLSSSSSRMRLLGTLIKPPVKKSHLSSKPYVIGLTGGSCSGKSNVCNYMYKLGAIVIDCDKLGHQAYLPGSELYNDIIKEFEPKITQSGEIDRNSLKLKTFQDKDKIRKLKDMTWPAIFEKVQKSIETARKNNKKIVVIEAALLIEADWIDYCHEIWVCMVPKDEALKRIQERDGINLDLAKVIINSQMSNEERIKHANVVFCTLWDPTLTEQQVEKAWLDLQERLKNK